MKISMAILAIISGYLSVVMSDPLLGFMAIVCVALGFTTNLWNGK